MDIIKVIQELHTEKKRLDDAIAALERAAEGKEPKSGRVWSSNSRRAAAERMRKYWEKRRAQGKDGRAPEPAE